MKLSDFALSNPTPFLILALGALRKTLFISCSLSLATPGQL